MGQETTRDEDLDSPAGQMASAAAAYGYQAPSLVQTFDPLFPQWLCNVNLPAGLVTMGCVTGTAMQGVTVK